MKLDVNCKDKSYQIVIEQGVLDHLKDYIKDDCRYFIISDSGVPYQYIEKVKAQLTYVDELIVPQGEGSKGFETYEAILKKMLTLHYSRKDKVIAIGGGVVGDLSGFVAASYMRGIEFINIPTTTLSQIDSSIGGKTAINVDGIKNCVGAFWQPSLVLIDKNVLSTLSRRHYHNGLIEAVKAGLIKDKVLFDIFENEDIDTNLETIIYRSLVMKKEVVEEDERETGIRKILNFGHTIGHGIESYYHLGQYYHGECVGLGMIMMLEDESIKERLIKVLKKLDAPVEFDAKVADILPYMMSDKKANHSKVTIVEVNELGKASWKTVTFEELKERMEKNHA